MSALIKAMNTSNSDSIVNNIFGAIETIETEDLILWIFVLVLICLGVLLNLLVMRSMLAIKFNGKCLESSLKYFNHACVVFFFKRA